MENEGIGSQDEIFRAAIPRWLIAYLIEGLGSCVFSRLAPYPMWLGWILLAIAAQVIGVMIVMISLGLLLDRFLFGKIEARIRRRWGLTVDQDSGKG